MLALLRGIYYIAPVFYSLSEMVVAALIVTGECGAETIAKQCNIFPSDNISPLDTFLLT